MDTQIISAGNPEAVARALATLQQGKLVAFPTDTVYGLGALAHDPGSIVQLYQVKDREISRAIPVLLGEVSALESVAVDIGPQALRLIEHFWPGPLTLVLPRHSSLPEILSAQPTIGVRMPDHPVALDLLRQSGPLAVTSANLSGGTNTVTASEVQEQLGGRIPLILDGGRTPGGVPSTVVDCTGPELVVLRKGPLSLEELYAAVGRNS